MELVRRCSKIWMKKMNYMQVKNGTIPITLMHKEEWLWYSDKYTYVRTLAPLLHCVLWKKYVIRVRYRTVRYLLCFWEENILFSVLPYGTVPVLLIDICMCTGNKIKKSYKNRK